MFFILKTNVLMSIINPLNLFEKIVQIKECRISKEGTPHVQNLKQQVILYQSQYIMNKIHIPFSQNYKIKAPQITTPISYDLIYTKASVSKANIVPFLMPWSLSQIFTSLYMCVYKYIIHLEYSFFKIYIIYFIYYIVVCKKYCFSEGNISLRTGFESLKFYPISDSLYISSLYLRMWTLSFLPRPPHLMPCFPTMMN